MNELDDADLTDDDLSLARSFVERATQFYDVDHQRLDAVRPSMQAAIHQDILDETTLKFGTKELSPDGRVRSISTPDGFEIIKALVEGKNEIGLGRTDPIVQAECDYVAIYTSDEVGKRCCQALSLLCALSSVVLATGGDDPSSMLLSRVPHRYDGTKHHDQRRSVCW